MPFFARRRGEDDGPVESQLAATCQISKGGECREAARGVAGNRRMLAGALTTHRYRIARVEDGIEVGAKHHWVQTT